MSREGCAVRSERTVEKFIWHECSFCQTVSVYILMRTTAAACGTVCTPGAYTNEWLEGHSKHKTGFRAQTLH